MLAATSDPASFGLLILRAGLGLFLAYHGYNKVFGGNGLSGTSSWFASIGMKWPRLQARLAASTEIGCGLLLATGFMTPLAAAGVLGVMIVAIVVAHARVGFFVFLPDQGWEYCATIALGAVAIGSTGPGRWSVDSVCDIRFDGWSGLLITAVLGVSAAALQLLTSYRPSK